MTVFTAHTVVHAESGPVFFGPGDELPEWAVGRVGDHVLSDPAEPGDKPDGEPDDEPDTEGGDEPEDPAEPGDKPDVPDFTKPAPRRRRK